MLLLFVINLVKPEMEVGLYSFADAAVNICMARDGAMEVVGRIQKFLCFFWMSRFRFFNNISK
jgi:hypothetical protein